MSRKWKNRGIALAWYLAGAALSLGIFWTRVGGSTLSFDIPYQYEGDVFPTIMMIRSMIAGEWFPYLGIHSRLAGAPFGFNLGDYPIPDQFHLLTFKALSLIHPDPAWVYNMFYFLSFAAVTVAFMFLVRRFRVSYPVALAFGVVYAFMPFHLTRYPHIFYAAYYTLPLMGVIVLRVWSARPLFLARSGGRWKLDLRSRRTWLALAALAVLGGCGVYNAYFFCFFLAVAGASAALRRHSRAHLVSALATAGVTMTVVALCCVPNLVYKHRRGANHDVAYRNPLETELYGLKLTNVFIPRSNDPFPGLREIHSRYQSGTQVVEGADESFALLGTLGSFFLLAWFFFASRRSTVYYKLGLLLASGILLGTIGGFSYFVALFLTPKIRCYNRISVFLALWALVGLAFLVNGARKRYGRRGAAAIAAALLVLGVFEQATPDFQGRQAPVLERYRSDRDFVRAIEERSPRDAMILELPYFAFPEVVPPYKMDQYSHARGMVFTDKLRWSYGVMRGRPEASQAEALCKLPLDLGMLRSRGFSGVYVDRFGYEDAGKAVLQQLSREIPQAKPIESRDGRFVYVPLGT